MNVVLNFHKGDQQSARLLLQLLLYADEGVPCAYYLQYGDHLATLEIEPAVRDFLAAKDAHFSNAVPAVDVPAHMIADDPNLGSYNGIHTKRTPAQKGKHLQWNLCVYKYIMELDSFLMLEPDCVVLKHGWLKDISRGCSAAKTPVYGHLKKGRIGGVYIPTHWAGCSVYKSASFRELQLERFFRERFPNPWWPLRLQPHTEAANNCFWGPVFSGYDISYDYFLYALYWMRESGSTQPCDWSPDHTGDGRKNIFCDFNSKLKTKQVLERFFGNLPLLHGIKDDSARAAVLREFRASSK
jgi:hypothetical protein